MLTRKEKEMLDFKLIRVFYELKRAIEVRNWRCAESVASRLEQLAIKFIPLEINANTPNLAKKMEMLGNCLVSADGAEPRWEKQPEYVQKRYGAWVKEKYPHYYDTCSMGYLWESDVNSWLVRKFVSEQLRTEAEALIKECFWDKIQAKNKEDEEWATEDDD